MEEALIVHSRFYAAEEGGGGGDGPYIGVGLSQTVRGYKSFFTSSRLHLLPLGIGAVEAREVFVGDPFLPGSSSGSPCPSSTDGPAKKKYGEELSESSTHVPSPSRRLHHLPPSSQLPPFPFPPASSHPPNGGPSSPPFPPPHIAGSRRKRELRLSSSMPAADGDTFCAGVEGKGDEKEERRICR